VDSLNIIYGSKKYDEVEGRGWRYFFKLGFLDGKPGLVWHFFQGGWYRFLVDAKIYEIMFHTKQVHPKGISCRGIVDGDSDGKKSKSEEQEEMKKIIGEILEKEYNIRF